MRNIPLSAVPSQLLTATIDERRYVLTLKEANGTMICDVSVDGVVLVSGSRVLAGEMLVPYQYLEDGGNFILQTTDDNLPNWQEFGVSQGLYYLSAAELEEIRG